MISNTGLQVERISYGAEPVDLDAIKRHLSIDFDDHNTLLEELIVSAREDIEAYLGLSIVDSTVTAYWDSICSSELPYGPVKTIISATDGVDDIDVTYSGIGYKKVIAERTYPTSITYEAGFTGGVPTAIKLAVMKHATDNFEQRTGISIGGNQTIQKFDNDWKNTCKRFSRKNFLQ